MNSEQQPTYEQLLKENDTLKYSKLTILRDNTHKDNKIKNLKLQLAKANATVLSLRRKGRILRKKVTSAAGAFKDIRQTSESCAEYLNTVDTASANHIFDNPAQPELPWIPETSCSSSN